MSNWLKKIPASLLLQGLRLMQDSMIFVPHPKGDPFFTPTLFVPSLIGMGLGELKPITLKTNDKLELLSLHKPAEAGKPTVLYLHGNTGHLGDAASSKDEKGKFLQIPNDPIRHYRLEAVRNLINAGFGVCALEYRGYGGNPGKPSEQGLLLDAMTAMRYLDSKGIPSNNIILYGDSLGAAVAIQLAKSQQQIHLPVALVVAVAPFASIALRARDDYPSLSEAGLKKHLRHSFDSLRHIKDLGGTPILIAHGENDITTPIHHSEKLLAAAKEASVSAQLVRFPQRGHVDIPTQEILPHLMQILASHKQEETFTTPPVRVQSRSTLTPPPARDRG